jgi:hypothetical protein
MNGKSLKMKVKKAAAISMIAIMTAIASVSVSSCYSSNQTNPSIDAKVDSEQNVTKKYSAYEYTVKPGDNVSAYWSLENCPMGLPDYIKIVQQINKDRGVFIDDAGNIRDGKKIILVDFNLDGKVGSSEFDKSSTKTYLIEVRKDDWRHATIDEYVRK